MTPNLKRKVFPLLNGLLLKETRLQPQELQFLIDQTKQTKKWIAALSAITPEHLSRVLHGRLRLRSTTEKLIRVVVAAYCCPNLCREILFAPLPYKEESDASKT